jgi:hypothetical protein
MLTLVDIVERGFDAGIRLGEKVQQDMIAMRLTGPFKVILVASPEYLDAKGGAENDRPASGPLSAYKTEEDIRAEFALKGIPFEVIHRLEFHRPRPDPAIGCSRRDAAADRDAADAQRADQRHPRRLQDRGGHPAEFAAKGIPYEAIHPVQSSVQQQRVLVASVDPTSWRTGLFFLRQWFRDATHAVDEKFRGPAERPIL